MADLTKGEMLSFLQRNNVPNIEILEDPGITESDLIPALLQYRIHVPDDFFSFVADRMGLLYMERDVLLSNTDLGCLLPFAVGDQALIVILESKPRYMRVATANPLNHALFEKMESLFGKTIERIVVPLDALATVTDGCYQAPHGYSALNELLERQPEESAYRILVPWQKAAVLLFAACIAVLLLFNAYFGLFVLFTLINITYFLMNPVKFYISLMGLSGTKKVIYVGDEEIKSVTDEELPVYTVLVPLFHEQEMLPHILQNIAEIEYPREKLDVKILMEEEDTETLEKARKLGLFGNVQEVISPMTEAEYHRFLSIFHPVVVPNAELKTKPRACNYGLKRARGEFVVIYDAEDLPDRDQLKKVYLAFRHLGPEYACVQCLLNFYNARRNLLTRWFSIEYSYYYDYYIQGLDKINAPIPLGGTSNHFRMKTLKELGAWDPFNVTEDADLGMRIARKKYKTGVLNSHTYEEAVPYVSTWIKQRSRWVKGFVITWFVTMRHPVHVLRDIGLKNFLIFQTGFGGNFYLPLMNLFLWMIFLLGFIIPSFFSDWFDFWPFAVIAVFNLVVGNVFFLVMMLLATWKEKKRDLLIYSLFSPIYWILMTIGAWKGFLQLIVKPYKWEKTTHGFTFINQELLKNEPENFSREIQWIDVKKPEMQNGRTKATLPQIGVSLGVTIILVFLALILFGVITVSPLSDHLTITAVPGLAQVLGPYHEYQAGKEVRLLNTEAIIRPDQTKIPEMTIGRPERTVSTAIGLTIAPETTTRPARTVSSETEPGLSLTYDPESGMIRITANQSQGVYQLLVSGAGTNTSYQIETFPGSFHAPEGVSPLHLAVVRHYPSGEEVTVLETTV